MRALLALLAFAVTAPAPAADKAPEVLQRQGDWIADYARDACHVYARFGEGDQEVIARFSRYDQSDGFRFALYGKRIRVRGATENVSIDFGLKGIPVTEQVWSGISADRPALFFPTIRLDGWQRPSITREMWKSGPSDPGPSITTAQEASLTGVTVAIPGKLPFRLDAGSLDKPFQVLRHCVNGLIERWGYDPEVQRTLARPLRERTYPGEWLTSNDYPEHALRGGFNGVVQFRLDVDAQGSILGCHLLERTEPDLFGDVTCRAVLRRASFEPALDANMKPVPSFYIRTFNWLVGFGRPPR